MENPGRRLVTRPRLLGNLRSNLHYKKFPGHPVSATREPHHLRVCHDNHRQSPKHLASRMTGAPKCRHLYFKLECLNPMMQDSYGLMHASLIEIHMSLLRITLLSSCDARDLPESSLLISKRTRATTWKHQFNPARRLRPSDRHFSDSLSSAISRSSSISWRPRIHSTVCPTRARKRCNFLFKCLGARGIFGYCEMRNNALFR
ncbi:hypothetical protein R3P38DRAFT_3000269 [Favolaschia claudopus]|uniref:Uncharacterized protein n=1 Tax=Favolaschia claudopus TaxID=2862362 RepID=A0AAW0AQ84_9AGAR